ncbi:MAG: type II toxin-antitoxin system RelE/ParE family toxin [Myxococcales bacterium]
MASRFRVRWTRLALQDLRSAKDYVAVDDPRAADRLVASIKKAVAHLSSVPRSGRVVPERRAQGYREVIVRPYRVVYAVADNEVQILRIWHSRRRM